MGLAFNSDSDKGRFSRFGERVVACLDGAPLRSMKVEEVGVQSLAVVPFQQRAGTARRRCTHTASASCQSRVLQEKRGQFTSKPCTISCSADQMKVKCPAFRPSIEGHVVSGCH